MQSVIASVNCKQLGCYHILIAINIVHKVSAKFPQSVAVDFSYRVNLIKIINKRYEIWFKYLLIGNLIITNKLFIIIMKANSWKHGNFCRPFYFICLKTIGERWVKINNRIRENHLISFRVQGQANRRERKGNNSEAKRLCNSEKTFIRPSAVDEDASRRVEACDCFV